MKAIKKGSVPRALQDHLAARVPKKWEPTYENLADKAGVLASLVREQHHLCAYCLGRIGKRVAPPGSDAHIDHLRPQSSFPEDELRYSNMVASCQGRSGKEPRAAPEHCGAARGDWFDQDSFVTPLWPDCERFFKYRENGDIEAVDDQGPVREGSSTTRRLAAEETMMHLRLTIPLLKRHRKAAIDEALSQLDERPMPSPRDQVETLIAVYGAPAPNGRLAPYCLAIVAALRRELVASSRPA